MFTNVPTQQPDGRLQNWRFTHTRGIDDNKEDTYETFIHRTKDRILKSFISLPYNTNTNTNNNNNTGINTNNR